MIRSVPEDYRFRLAGCVAQALLPAAPALMPTLLADSKITSPPATECGPGKRPQEWGRGRQECPRHIS